MEAIRELSGKAGELPEGRCLAGFSGGADSTAMMFLLAAERDAGRIQPEAVHVNHGLRGAESDGDEAFCAEICRRLRIPLHTEHAELNGRTDENACREARFRCFRKVMDETRVDALVLAHNRDDLAETFLMRLIRGAGGEGLACMSGRDEHGKYTVFRPLLKAGREEIREALRADGIPWREDSLNQSSAYLRNRVRGELIPLMDELNPGAAERIARTAEIAAGENRMLQAAAERFLARHSFGRWLDAEALSGEPEPLGNRILRTWWKRNAPEREEHALSARQTAEMAALAGAARGKMNLPGGLHAVKGAHGMYLTGFPETTAEEIPFAPGVSTDTGYGEIRLEMGPSEGNPGDGMTAQEAPEDFFRGCVIRTRRKGDRIRPFGMEGSRKLQDYFTDRGIDEPVRDMIPLLCRGDEVLLAAGVGAGGVPRWNENERNIRLRWTGRMIWNPGEREEADDGNEL